MKNAINTIQDEIIDECSSFQDYFDLYEHLISLGKTHEQGNTQLQTDEYALTGCQSQVWIKATTANNRIHFTAFSDSLIINGIISLLLRTLNDQPPVDVTQTDLYFLEKIGLTSHLSPSRTNGVTLIIKQIKQFAEQS